MHNSFLYAHFYSRPSFGQPCAHHQENQLYQCDTWYMSLCVDDRLVCRSVIPTCKPHGHLQRVTYTRCCIHTIDSPDDGAHGCPKHVENRNDLIRRNCASSWFVCKEQHHIIINYISFVILYDGCKLTPWP